MNDVIPKEGVNDIKFGFYEKDLISKLGSPEEISKNTDTVTYYYWSKGLSFHFYADMNFRLCDIECTKVPHEIYGSNLNGFNKEQILRWCNDKNLNAHLAYDTGKELECIEINDIAVYLWMKNDKYESIQLSVLLDNNEKEIWP
jgi:hypothetical protein